MTDLKYITDLIWDIGVTEERGLGHCEEICENVVVGQILLIAKEL